MTITNGLRRTLLVCLTAWSAVLPAQSPDVITVGSKVFTESVILGEVAAHIAGHLGHKTIHKRQLGGSRVLWKALESGDIDIYPEYTGTLIQEILNEPGITTLSQLKDTLARKGIAMTDSLGFNNTYILGMKDSRASSLDIRTISDLKHHPALVLGFSNEFMDRADGWPGLRDHYDLPHENVRGLNHDLAYHGLESGALDVTDLYATDAEIAYYQLRPLKDDRGFFPAYHAVFVYRAPLARQYPRFTQRINQLSGRITSERMITMNARVKIVKRAESAVAAEFINQQWGFSVNDQRHGILALVWRYTVEHFTLVILSLTAAVLMAVPLGIAAARRPWLGQWLLAGAGMLQTIPFLALLVLLIPVFGIGWLPAVVALFLYSLLPIMRNTYSGLHDIPYAVRESAMAIGLPPWARLWHVELPMATRSILAGVKTAAVINVGTATLGALIGAGGYGQPMLAGIRRDDFGMMVFQGAIPAVVMTLAVQAVFEIIERKLLPRSLRYSTQR